MVEQTFEPRSVYFSRTYKILMELGDFDFFVYVWYSYSMKLLHYFWFVNLLSLENYVDNGKNARDYEREKHQTQS